MSTSIPPSLLQPDHRLATPSLLTLAAPADAAGWVDRHRTARRALVAEHGAVLVRGLGLSDATDTGAVFRRPASGLMIEREAFAPRQSYPGGVYSSSRWPANQPMCMHSREDCTGPREVLVGLADPVRLVDCSPTLEVAA